MSTVSFIVNISQKFMTLLAERQGYTVYIHNGTKLASLINMYHCEATAREDTVVLVSDPDR